MRSFFLSGKAPESRTIRVAGTLTQKSKKFFFPPFRIIPEASFPDDSRSRGMKVGFPFTRSLAPVAVFPTQLLCSCLVDNAPFLYTTSFHSLATPFALDFYNQTLPPICPRLTLPTLLFACLSFSFI